MRVQSPVGTFPVGVRRVRFTLRGPAIDASMGAWRSEVTFDRTDLPVAAMVLAAAALLVAAGRATSGHR